METTMHKNIICIVVLCLLSACTIEVEVPLQKRAKYYIHNESNDSVLCLYHYHYVTNIKNKDKLDTLLVPQGAMCIMKWDNKDTLIRVYPPSSFLRDMLFESMKGDTLRYIETIDNNDWCAFDTVQYDGVGKKWKYVYN